MISLQEYMVRLALRRATIISGEINVTVLLSLEERHLPRLQEIIRILHQNATHIASLDAEDDAELLEPAISESLNLLGKIESLSQDGLLEMKYEEDEEAI